MVEACTPGALCERKKPIGSDVGPAAFDVWGWGVGVHKGISLTGDCPLRGPYSGWGRTGSVDGELCRPRVTISQLRERSLVRSDGCLERVLAAAELVQLLHEPASGKYVSMLRTFTARQH